MAIRFDFYATNSIGIMRKKRKKIYKKELNTIFGIITLPRLRSHTYQIVSDRIISISLT